MPLLGMHETLKTGKPLPHPLFWDAAAINDVSAQSRFYSLDTARQLQDLQLDSQPGSKLPRLASLRAHKLSHQLVWRAEQGKIALSDHEHNHQTLNELERAGGGTHPPQLASASAPLLEKIGELMDEAILAAGVQPDRVFVTAAVPAPPHQGLHPAETAQGTAGGVMTSVQWPRASPAMPSACLRTETAREPWATGRQVRSGRVLPFADTPSSPGRQKRSGSSPRPAARARGRVCLSYPPPEPPSMPDTCYCCSPCFCSAPAAVLPRLPRKTCNTITGCSIGWMAGPSPAAAAIPRHRDR